MNTKSIVLGLTAIALVTVSCKAQSNDRQRRQGPPSVDEIFEQMDEDEDGLLSEEEVKGPLKDKFTDIDTDEDGFLSKEEVEKAPKPKRRGPR
ncbi:EF-hand domain-containing protein [Ulvibacterium marinum]|uniref:EF-hand domain-containing protein n=1 Tax=Ulvibacterium marinum TaxID=2419782 RepID=A0A3B0C6Y6_9FLAO|nr:EF-hand domain-containing protein [Ulvibacterium marinum]RKN80284.1 EF-hand domain-containing protein [Ulvibacterium marinum]